MNEVTTLISNVGFPIVACVFMFKQNMKLTETITHLTSTMDVINERLEKIENVTLKEGVFHSHGEKE